MARAVLALGFVLASFTVASAEDKSYRMMIQVQDGAGRISCEVRAVDKTNRVIAKLPGPCTPEANEQCLENGLCIRATP